MIKNKHLRLLVRNFHENGLKVVLENPGNIHDLLQLLDVQLLPRIDFTKMQAVPGHFVGRDYRHLESDLVLQVSVAPAKAHGERQRVILYILIEHQSEPDRFMPLRVLEYVVMIYKQQMRDWLKKHKSLEKFNLQPVLPIVLYTGTRTWEKLGQLWELVDLGAELEQRIPALQPLFLNLGQTSDAALAHGGEFGLLLHLVQQRRVPLPAFAQKLRHAVRVIEGLADSDRQRWLELMSYIDALIYNERDEPEQEPLLEIVANALQNDAHRKEVFDMGKTIAEHLVDKGRKEGLEKGLEKGREEGLEKGLEKGLEEGEVRNQRRILVRLLRNKFGKVPAAMVKQIEAAERIDVLDQWFDQAMTAKKIADLSFTAG